MPTSKQLRLQHLLWRGGFGPDSRDWPAWTRLDERNWWPRLSATAAPPPKPLEVADGVLDGVVMGLGELGKLESRKKDENPEARKKRREMNRRELKSLNLIWLEEMVQTQAQLREKMALFWHGHFASRNINVLYQQQLLQIFREQALGNFADLLRTVSKSAAMLAFLNNQQNKKQKPNENFAREVMELFTLGRGHYTETDIKEAARAFTGWGFQLDGTFVFRRLLHDAGVKTVLGKKGKFDGDDVLDILLEQRQTARFVARKLYRFLVNEEEAPEERITELADRFYGSGYAVMPLLEAIFTSDWFYEENNIGRKIKSPVELWVGLRRTLPLTLDEPEGQLLLQKALGQVLLYPPNVAGWPGGRSWIDSSSLMLRLRLPHIVAAQSDLDISTKDDDDQLMGRRQQGRLQKRLAMAVDWQPLLALFSEQSEADMLPSLARFLWQTPAANPPAAVLKAHTQAGARDQLIQSIALQLMATPEYQLC